MRTRHMVVATAALVLLPATAALAHPAFNPNAIPVGEPVDSTLVVPHGCAPGGGMPDGDAEPTVQVDLGYTDQVAVEARDVDGWSAEDDGEAIVWTEAGGATTDPIELPVTLTVTEGAEGDQVFLPALQTCQDGSTFRWVATPGQDGDPAVRIELTAGQTGTVDVPDEDHEMDMDVDASEPVQDTGAPTTSEATEGQDQPSPATDAAASEDGTGGSGTEVAVVALLLGLALLGGVVAFRRKGSA